MDTLTITKSSLIEYQTHSTMPGIGNLANYPGLVKSWVFPEVMEGEPTMTTLLKKKKLQSLVTLSIVFPTPTDTCSSHLSWRKFSLQQTEVITENHSQPNCRVVEHSPSGYTTTPCKAQGSLHRRVQKECKSQRNNMEFLVRLCHLGMSGATPIKSNH